MGNRATRDVGHRPQKARPSVFEAAAMIIHGNVPSVTTVPTCLDELADWTEEAAKITNHLDKVGMQVLPDTMQAPVRFLAFINQEQVNSKAIKGVDDGFVTQKDVIHFPKECRFERASFYVQHVIVSLEEAATTDSGCVTSYLMSGLEFSAYYRLLRRLVQLSELEEPKSLMTDSDTITSSEEELLHAADECAICMTNRQETVLPCLHGVCTLCEQKWVETHMDCPFCRKKYYNHRRRRREQWQLQSWQGDDVQEDMATLQAKLHLFWEKGRSDGENANICGYTRLGCSLNETIVDDDFVLLS